MSDPKLQGPMDRRNFLQMAGGFVLLAGLSGGNRFPALARHARSRTIADLHFADFDALRGDTFLVSVEDARPLSVQLDIVKRGGSPATPHHEWYSLAFSGPKGQTLAQGTYAFSHPQIGRFDLFIVPAMAVDHEERYIAIINRI